MCMFMWKSLGFRGEIPPAPFVKGGVGEEGIGESISAFRIPPLKNGVRGISLLVLSLFVLSCDSGTGNSCVANVDCGEGFACVAGSCIDDTSKCESIGAFVDIFEASPKNADNINEMHVTVDNGGAVHYCYFGSGENGTGSYYGRQTAWDTFVEELIETEDTEVFWCGGLAVTDDGVPYILSRSPSAIVFKNDGDWEEIEIHELSSSTASGALKGDDTVVSMIPDHEGGIYLSMSLGFETSSQPVFLARVNDTGMQVLKNGWDDDGQYTAVGHAPQFVTRSTGAELVMGRIIDFDVLLADADLNITTEIDGGYARAASGPDDSMYVLFIDHNQQLYLNTIENGTFIDFAELGYVGFPTLPAGRLPWNMGIDSNGDAHLLIQDATQGEDVLTYRKVNGTDVSEPRIVAENMAVDLAGEQTFAIATDICDRSTAVVITMQEPDDLDFSGEVLPVIRIIEER
ncbi:MAG: hypothetical protein GY847_41875 [Proteobacteria bacterium]|nr:hypothetical protein [Pseudomonadota bacterium]